jgi:hypothetical protein
VHKKYHNGETQACECEMGDLLFCKMIHFKRICSKKEYEMTIYIHPDQTRSLCRIVLPTCACLNPNPTTTAPSFPPSVSCQLYFHSWYGSLIISKSEREHENDNDPNRIVNPSCSSACPKTQNP